MLDGSEHVCSESGEGRPGKLKHDPAIYSSRSVCIGNESSAHEKLCTNGSKPEPGRVHLLLGEHPAGHVYHVVQPSIKAHRW